MSSTRNSKNLLTNVFRPAYVYDASGFHTSLVLSNIATVDADTLKTGTLAIGDQGGNIYVGSNSGVPYDTNSTNFNNVALGVGAAGNISNVSNSVFIGSNAGLALTNATDTTIIGTNDTVVGTRNVVIGSRDFVYGNNNVIIGSDLSTNESYRLNIGNLILGDISLGGNLQFNANVVISGTLQCDAFNAGALDTSNLVVPGYIRNAAGATPVTMDMSLGNFRFSGTSFSRVADVSFYRGRVDASAGIVGTGYDLSSALTLTGDISGGGKVSAVNFFGTPSASNRIGGVTLSNTNISYAGTITGTTDSASNKIGGITLSNTNISYAGTITGSTDNTSNKIGGVTLNNTNISYAGTITGSTDNTSNKIGGVTLNNTNISYAGTITGTTDSASNKIGGITLSNTNISYAGTITGSTDNTSNKIGGVTLNNTRITAANGIAGTNFDLSSGLRLTGDISGSGRVSASNFFGSLSASNSIGGVVLANGNLLTVSGTVSVPSHTFSTDSSMGMYYVGSQALGFSVGGSNRMTICGDRVAVNTTNPITRFQVNPTVAVAAVKTYDSNAAMVVQPTPTSSSAINDPTPVLYLGREGTGAQAYGSLATMNLCRWENNSVNSRTRMDLALTHDAYNDVNIMSIRSDGRVGIGTTTPATALDVSGDISGTNITYTGTISNSTTSSSNRIGGIVLSNGNVRSDPTDTFMVAVGNASSSNIATSPDGITWTARASPFTTLVNAVAWNGSLWVAAGSGTTRIATSTDGITWTAQTSPFGTNSFAAAWNGSIWVAGGSGATRLATSPDAITWTGRTFPGSGEVRTVAWNGSIWVAGGGTGTIATSTDGITWTAQTSPFSTNCYEVAWNGSIWIAVGEGTNTIATSTDGITWTGRGSGIFTSLGIAVAWNGSLWVATGNGTNTIATSTDGITWTARTSPFTTSGLGVAWNGSLWVATGSGTNTIATSSDGITWTERAASIGTFVNGVASRRYVLPLINSSISLLSNGTIATTNAIIGSNSATSNSIGGVTLTNSNVLTGSGSVSVPSHAFSTDASLGLYRVGANILGFASAGSNRMTISNSNVGIGTIAPSATLEVSGGLPLVLNRGVAGQNNFITLLNSSSIRWGIGVANADTGSGNGGSDFNLISYTDAGAFNATPFVIRRANGYVGIGTSNPGAPLDVITGAVVVGRLGNMTGNTDVSMCVEGSANIGMYTLKGTNNNFGGISFKTLSNATLAERMRIDANTGNVGIGRTAPVVALDVGGDISGANVTLTGRITTGSANSNVVGGVLMSNGFLRPGAGNEGSPGFAFLTDVSSGIFSGGTDIVNFVTAGRNRMTVFGSNIGIGVRAPNAILDVCGGVIKIQNRASNLGGTNYLSLFDISSSSNGVARIALALNNPAVGANVGNDFAINTYDDAGSYVDTPFVVTRANGFIGMGATVPATQLDVMGAGTGNTTVLRISSGFRGSGNSNNIARLRLAHRVATGADLSYDIMANEVATANNYGLTFGGYGNEGVIRMDMGNRRLGINTVAPSFTLDVCGTIRGSSNIVSVGTATYSMGATWNSISASTYTDIMSLSFTPKQSGNVTLIVTGKMEVQMVGTGGDDTGNFRLTDGVPNELAFNTIYTAVGSNNVYQNLMWNPLIHVGTFSGAQTFKLQYQAGGGASFQVRRGVITVYEVSLT